MKANVGTQLSRAEMKVIRGGCNTPPCTLTWWFCDNCYIACSIDTPPVESVPGCPGSSTNCTKSTQACTNAGYVSCC